jgi:hypothetical protein
MFVALMFYNFFVNSYEKIKNVHKRQAPPYGGDEAKIEQKTLTDFWARRSTLLTESYKI